MRPDRVAKVAKQPPCSIEAREKQKSPIPASGEGAVEHVRIRWIGFGASPPPGGREGPVPYSLRKAFVLRNGFQSGGDLVIDGDAGLDPGHGVAGPAPSHRSGQGEDHEPPERDSLGLPTWNAGRRQAVDVARGDDGIGMLQEGKQRDVELFFSYPAPYVRARGQAFADLFKGLVRRWHMGFPERHGHAACA